MGWLCSALVKLALAGGGCAQAGYSWHRKGWLCSALVKLAQTGVALFSIVTTGTGEEWGLCSGIDRWWWLWSGQVQLALVGDDSAQAGYNRHM